MSFYGKNTKEIVNLLEDLEKRLDSNRPKSQNVNANYNYDNNNNNRANFISYNNNNSNNFQEYPFMNNQSNFSKISPSMEFNIRKIIQEEFNSLIIPYQQELNGRMNLIESKVDKNSNEIKNSKFNNLNNFSNSNLGFNFNQPNPLDNSQYVLRVEYDNKMNELEIQISTLNSISKTLKEAFDNKSMDNNNNNYLDRDEFGQKLKEIQNQFDSISGEINKCQKNIMDFKQSLSEIRINSNKMQNDLLTEIQNIKNDFSEKVQNMSNNFNNINGIIQNQTNANDVNGKIQNINMNLNNLKNEFDVFTKQLDMNFMGSLKTIVNQHVTIAEFNEVKNTISGCENDIKNIINKNKNYDININNIQNKLNSLENNINNKNNSEIGELSGFNNKNNINLDEYKLNILNELQNIDMNKLKTFDFDSVNELKNEINFIKNNNENSVILRTKINELDTEIKKLKERIDFDKTITDLKNDINNLEQRIKKLESLHNNEMKASTLKVVPIQTDNNVDNKNDINNLYEKDINIKSSGAEEINREANNNINQDKSKNKEVITSANYLGNPSINENNLNNNKDSKNFALDEDEFEEPEEDNVMKNKNTNVKKPEEEKKENEENQNDNTKKNNDNNNVKASRNDDFDIGDLDDILIGD